MNDFFEQMPDQKQNISDPASPEEKPDKYEELKEELGYDDEDIRVLAGSVKMKALGVLGDERERKITYLMREREKRDRANLEYIKEGIPKGIGKANSREFYQFLDQFKNNSDFLQYIDEDKRVKDLLPSLVSSFGGLIGNDLDRFKRVVDKLWEFYKLGNEIQIRGYEALRKTRIIYEDNIDMFELLADFVCRHNGYLEDSTLIGAKVVYGNDIDMFKSFLEVAEAVNGSYRYALENLERASSIYGYDKELFNIFVEAAKNITQLPVNFLNENPDLYTFDGTIDHEMLKAVINVASKFGWRQNKALKTLVEAKNDYGNDRERFEILANIFLVKNYSQYEVENLEKFHKVRGVLGYCKDDNDKLRMLAEVPNMAEEIVKLEDLYGDDKGLLGKLVKIGKQDKYGRDLEVVKQYLKVNGRNKEFFSDFLDIVIARGSEAGKALLEAAELYNKDPALFPLFVSVANSGKKENSEHSYMAVRSLLPVGRVYSDNPAMFQKFVELAKEDRGILCENYFECRSLYGNDIQKAELVKTKMLALWQKWGFYATEPVAMANKMYGADMEKFDYVIGLLDKLATYDANIAYEFSFTVCEHVSSIKTLESLIDKVMGGADRRRIYILAGLQGMYGEDAPKMDKVSSLLDDLSGKVSEGVLRTLENTARAYGVNDERSLMELVKILENIEKTVGSSACNDLELAHWIYKEDKKMFMAFVEVAKEKGADAVHMLRELSNIYKDNEKRFYDVVSLIRKHGAEGGKALNLALERKNNADKFDEFILLTNKQGAKACRALTKAGDVYGENVNIFQVFYKICLEGYDDLLLDMVSENDLKEFFLNACESFIDESKDVTSVSAKRILELIAEEVLQKLFAKPEWYKHIFVVAQFVQIINSTAVSAKKILDIQGQINVPAVMAKIDSHLKPFTFSAEESDKKLDLIGLYADFLKDFNGMLVPTVWHMYCLLKDPSLGDYLENKDSLNNTREVENITDINDLKIRIREIKEGILLGDVDMENYKQSDLALAVLDDMTKVSASDWKRENRPLRTIVGEYEQHEDEIIEKFNPLVYKSGFIPVREVTESLKRDPALDQEVDKIQSSIKRFIGEDGRLIAENTVLEILKGDLGKKIKDAMIKLEKVIKSGKSANGEILNEKALEFTGKTLVQLEVMTAEVPVIDSLEKLVHMLLASRIANLDLESEVRTIFYYYGARRQNLAEGDSWVGSDPSLVDSAKLVEFLSDTILLEVVQGKSAEEGPDVHLNKQEKKLLKKEFSGLLNFLNQKQEEEKAYKDKTATCVRNIAVLAGRGLLAELSGFYCDACWTQRANILHDNPTMVGHTFVEEFEDKERSRVIGGCLTLESSINVADQNTGKESASKVLVVRGLNPQNAYINRYVTEDFVEHFLDYVQETARKTGAEYVVLPLHSVGALSNRPQIISYLQKKYGGGKRVSLNDDIDFNGYTIKDSCVVVRVVKENARKGKLPKPSNVPVEQQVHWIGSW